MYHLNKDERNMLQKIQGVSYLQEAIRLIEDFVESQNNQKQAYLSVFDEIDRILEESESFVLNWLEGRKNTSEPNLIISQAVQKIAGDSFSYLVVYIFLKNKEEENINSNIFITSSPSTTSAIKKEYKKIYTIHVDGETQKPDCDLLIYSLREEIIETQLKKRIKIETKNVLDKCLILSLKTSLRERAGQTYRWKLLLEIAQIDNPIKDRYNILYDSNIIPFVCFATTDFHNEINNPQQRGMFKFFDKAFIAKNIDADFIARMSQLPQYINEVL